MDCWNPETFDKELRSFLSCYSNLICDYFCEGKRLMDEHLNSDPYQSLKPNKYYSAYSNLLEKKLTPLLLQRSIRVWHYTRLLENETSSIKKCI